MGGRAGYRDIHAAGPGGHIGDQHEAGGQEGKGTVAMAKIAAKTTTFRPGRGYSKTDWDDVSDPHKSTDVELAAAKPFAEALPELAAAFEAEIARRKGGRPKAAVTKQTIALRVDPDILAAFKATGPGWQTRMHDALKDWLARHHAA